MPESRSAFSLGTAVFSGFAAVAGFVASLSPELTTFQIGEVIVDLGMVVFFVPLISKAFKVGPWQQETWLGAPFSGVVLALSYMFWFFGLVVAPLCVVLLKRALAAEEQQRRDATTPESPND